MAILLPFPPDQGSYNIGLAAGAISTGVQGGAARYRNDYVSASNIANVRWTVNKQTRDAIVAFIEDAHENGTIPFQLDLYGKFNDGEALSRHTVNVVPGSFRQTGTAGDSHTLVAQLEVHRQGESAGRELRASQAIVYAAAEGQSDRYANILEQVVNVTLANQSGLP